MKVTETQAFVMVAARPRYFCYLGKIRQMHVAVEVLGTNHTTLVNAAEALGSNLGNPARSAARFVTRAKHLIQCTFV